MGQWLHLSLLTASVFVLSGDSIVLHNRHRTAGVAVASFLQRKATRLKGKDFEEFGATNYCKLLPEMEIGTVCITTCGRYCSDIDTSNKDYELRDVDGGRLDCYMGSGQLSSQHQCVAFEKPRWKMLQKQNRQDTDSTTDNSQQPSIGSMPFGVNPPLSQLVYQHAYPPFPAQPSPYPAQPSPYPAQPSPYPAQPSPYPAQQYPAAAAAQQYPAAAQQYPAPAQQYPYPAQPSPYSAQQYPPAAQQYPAPAQQYPAPAQQYPAPAQQYPAPAQSYQSLYPLPTQSYQHQPPAIQTLNQPPTNQMPPQMLPQMPIQHAP